MTDTPTRPPSSAELAAVREFETAIKELGENDARLEHVRRRAPRPSPEASEPARVPPE
jgi:hypothetical protein